jgi:hypothetical protein
MSETGFPDRIDRGGEDPGLEYDLTPVPLAGAQDDLLTGPDLSKAGAVGGGMEGCGPLNPGP